MRPKFASIIIISSSLARLKPGCQIACLPILIHGFRVLYDAFRMMHAGSCKGNNYSRLE